MSTENYCKYCNKLVSLLVAEGLQCAECKKFVHLDCLQKGTVPGGLTGDVFFVFTCENCSLYNVETFIRDKMPWFQVIVLSLYHMSLKTPALARRGFFHWKTHIASFIDKQWEVLFPKEFKRKKKWMGTVSGTLSIYSPQFFVSGTNVFQEQGWWTLAYPRLSPAAAVQLNSDFVVARQKAKELQLMKDDLSIFLDILHKKEFAEEFLQPTIVTEQTPFFEGSEIEFRELAEPKVKPFKSGPKNLKKRLLPSLDNFQKSSNKKLHKEYLGADVTESLMDFDSRSSNSSNLMETVGEDESPKFRDPLCHYNTSLRDISADSIPLQIKLLGGIREELLYSPYSGLFLKPYIRRDTTVFPSWLQMMAEAMLKVNKKDSNYNLPPRSCLDYTYVQPEHIPAVNSLCNNFFWHGIDLTECLQYPEFSCIVMYKKLVVGFAFLVPDVKFNENYLSFIFTRPGWRNAGIGRFMLYHLIQTCIGKDITLHVSTNNPALLLYQKMGFKVERIVKGFYDKYMRDDTRESKDAFLCRLDR